MRGQYVVTSWKRYPRAILGTAERELIAWFASNAQAGETWLDIGAHCGYTALALCNFVGREGRVFAFEPVLTTVGHLSGTKTANGADQLCVVPFGLGDPDELERHEIRPVRGMASARAYQTDEGALEYIFVARLDAIWKSVSGGDEKLSGIKLDVGMQTTSALRGMAGLLKQHRPKLVLEVPTAGDLEPMLQTLEDLGLDTAGDPVDGGSTSNLSVGKSYAFSWRGAV